MTLKHCLNLCNSINMCQFDLNIIACLLVDSADLCYMLYMSVKSSWELVLTCSYAPTLNTSYLILSYCIICYNGFFIHHQRHISCCYKASFVWGTQVRFCLSVETPVNKRDNTLDLIRSCSNEVYEVDKSKEDTWEAWSYMQRQLFGDHGSVVWTKNNWHYNC